MPRPKSDLKAATLGTKPAEKCWKKSIYFVIVGRGRTLKPIATILMNPPAISHENNIFLDINISLDIMLWCVGSS